MGVLLNGAQNLVTMHTAETGTASPVKTKVKKAKTSTNTSWRGVKKTKPNFFRGIQYQDSILCLNIQQLIPTINMNKRQTAHHRGCRFSLGRAGDIQNLTEHCPGQPALG